MTPSDATPAPLLGNATSIPTQNPTAASRRGGAVLTPPAMACARAHQFALLNIQPPHQDRRCRLHILRQGGRIEGSLGVQTSFAFGPKRVTIRFGRERGARQSPVQFGLSLASA